MKTSTKAPRASINLETLEERVNLSTTLYNGDLYIYGTNASETVQVTYSNGYYKVSQTGTTDRYFHYSSVTGGDVYFYGYNGNDYFRNWTGLRTTAYGMNGNDTLIGSYNNDRLDGGNGADRLYGLGGNDTLIGGYDYSTNYLYGGSGNDSMYGGYGTDVMYGESGNDYLFGNYGNDYLYGGTGYDRLYGSYGNDRLDGGDDGVRDYLNGGSGYDRFQRDWYWTGYYWSNRDYPADYSSSYDSFYG